VPPGAHTRILGFIPSPNTFYGIGNGMTSEEKTNPGRHFSNAEEKKEETKKPRGQYV
jgi:hypothetical protein